MSPEKKGLEPDPASQLKTSAMRVNSNDKPINEKLLTAAECASRIGLTVRALRLYEARGLLTPRRTEKNWRLYGAREIARLSEILVLKQLGLSLSSIVELLVGQETRFDDLLAVQQVNLTERRNQMECSLRLVTALREKTARGEVLNVEELLKLAKETQMSEPTSEAMAWKRYEQSRPRVEIPADPGTLSDYVGSFLFSDGLVARITLEGERLFIQLVGQPPVELYAEEKDRFFMKVTPAQVSFTRTQDGEIDAMTLHQGGFEQRADRSTSDAFEAAEIALAERVRKKESMPGGEKVLRRVINEHRAGKPSYDQMGEPLAQLVREQLPLIVPELERLGEVKKIDFKGVGPDGFDVYDVRFENGALEWGLCQTSDGKLSGLYLRPTP